MNIKIKRLDKDVIIPSKAHSTDACFDICAFEKGVDVIEMLPGQVTKIHTGFATEIETGYYCAVYARSGVATKQNIRPANCVGIIDSDYRGEWILPLFNDSNEIRYIHNGDRVAQFAVLPVLDSTIIEVDELSDTQRGQGGFGSSGK